MKRISKDHLLYHLGGVGAILLMATIFRYDMVAKGTDTFTANMIFIVVICVLAFAYFMVIEFLEDVVFAYLSRKLRKRNPITSDKPEQETTPIAAAENAPEEDTEKAGHSGGPIIEDTTPVGVCREYSRIVLRNYVSADDLARLDRYIEIYAEQTDYKEIHPIKTNALKKPDLYHFGWSVYKHINKERYNNKIGQYRMAVWLQRVFLLLEDTEPETIQKKLTTNVNCLISLDDNIRATVIKSRLSEKEGE